MTRSFAKWMVPLCGFLRAGVDSGYAGKLLCDECGFSPDSKYRTGAMAGSSIHDPSGLQGRMRGWSGLRTKQCACPCRILSSRCAPQDDDGVSPFKASDCPLSVVRREGRWRLAEADSPSSVCSRSARFEMGVSARDSSSVCFLLCVFCRRDLTLRRRVLAARLVVLFGTSASLVAEMGSLVLGSFRFIRSAAGYGDNDSPSERKKKTKEKSIKRESAMRDEGTQS